MVANELCWLALQCYHFKAERHRDVEGRGIPHGALGRIREQDVHKPASSPVIGKSCQSISEGDHGQTVIRWLNWSKLVEN